MTDQPDPMASDGDQLDRLRWDIAAEAGDIGSFEWNLVTGTLTWDDRLIAMYGYDVGDERFDHSIASVNARVHPDDADLVAAAMSDAIAAAGPIQVTYRIVRPDGRVRWLEARGRAVPDPADPAGPAVRLLGVSWDVTRARESEARSERLLETMPVGFLAMDTEWRVVFANTEAEQLLGLADDALIGHLMWELFPDSEHTEFGATYRRVAATTVSESFEAYYPAPLDAWYEVLVWPEAEGVSLFFLDVTSRRSTQDLLQLSVDIGEHLVGAVSADAAVSALARLVVPRLADWSIVTLADGPDSLRDVQTWHRDPALRPVLDQYVATRAVAGRDNLARRVQQSGEPIRVDRLMVDERAPTLRSRVARHALDELNPASAVLLPLLADDTVAGVLTLARDDQRPPMNDQELAVAMSLCRRTGLAIDNAHLYAAQSAAAEHDRTVARALQEALLTRLPESRGLSLAARYITAADGDQVGGDWYDAIVRDDGATMLMIGDVVGHDIRAAAVMGQLRGMLRTFAWDHHDDDPSDLICRLDRAAQQLHMSTMASLLVGRLDPPDDPPEDAGDRGWTLTWTNAGHPPPVLLLADGTTELLEADRPDVLIGVVSGADRHDHVYRLPTGSAILLYTDGLIETRTHDLDDGIARLRTALASHHALPSDELLDLVLDDMVHDRIDDDIAVLLVRLDGHAH